MYECISMVPICTFLYVFNIFLFASTFMYFFYVRDSYTPMECTLRFCNEIDFKSCVYLVIL